MNSINIPTPDELPGQLSGLDRLLTATRWERAAIVYAYTLNEGPGGDQRSNLNTEVCFPMPMAQFARQGYKGLSSEQTVRAYRKNWEAAVDAGVAVPTEPGMPDVAMPDLPWPPPGGQPVGHGQGVIRTRESDTPERKAEVARRLLEKPGVREAYLESLGSAGPVERKVFDQAGRPDLDLERETRSILAGGTGTTTPLHRPSSLADLAAGIAADQGHRERLFAALAKVLDEIVAEGPYGEESTWADQLRRAQLQILDSIVAEVRS